MENIEKRVEQLLESAASQDPLAACCQQLLEDRHKLQRRLDRIGRISDGYQAQLRQLNHDLSDANDKLSTALSEVRTLRGIIPMCSMCKRVRDDEGFWDEVETYLGKNSEAVLSQGLCPNCARSAEADSASARSSAVRRVEEEEAEERNRLKQLLSSGAHQGHPLLEEHVRLSKRFTRLARRLEKSAQACEDREAQLKELNAAVRQASLSDPLTGLANRKAMMTRLEAEANRSCRTGKPFLVLMADVDHFRRINEDHGHQAGDQILKELGQLLQTNLRSFDLCARWGGEEFLVLLVETPPDSGLAVCEKLRAKVEAHSLVYEGQRLSCTFSAGVATHEPEATVEETLKAVERALYSAKRAGRNRLATADSRG